MSKYILTMDQGTSSSRCLLIDAQGRIAATAQEAFEQIYPLAGWVEHDPETIWRSQCRVAREAMANAGVTASDILCIAITNQRETALVWDKRSGKPVSNAIVWQCRRTAPMVQALKAQGVEPMVQAKTGLVMDAYFSASKIQWILDNVSFAREEAERGNLLFGTVDSWLIWCMTEGKRHVIDISNASRTMLFNIHTLQWDEELLELFHIPRGMMPEPVASSGHIAYSEPEIFGGAIPIMAAVGDQGAALYGQHCHEQGQTKCTYGTGSFLLMNTGAAVASQSRMLTTIAWHKDGQTTYALEGSIFVAGALVQWLRDELGLIRSADETEALAFQVENTLGVYLVPAFTGLGAPYWDGGARGLITGLTRGAGRTHLVRAALEAVAYQTKDVLVAMENDSGIKIPELRADGGAAANRFLMQFQADILDIPVRLPKSVESTALGAAALAGAALGMEMPLQLSYREIFEPRISASEINRLYDGWRKAVARSRSDFEM